jgi:diguanylate cyclase (GGDEF)-like protein
MSAQEFAVVAMGACVLLAVGAGAGEFVRLIRSVRESEERLERLERLASTDDLTGLPNRRRWEEELPRELGRSLRYDEPVCVAMLDLDHFKEYNDAYGHQVGDRLLKDVAAAWREVLRPYDLLARWGGEEFGLILAGSDLEEGIGVIERLRRATPDGISCSAGIAEWDRNEYPKRLVGRADEALYEAKRSGRDQTIATPLAH